jgi:hypothetical protein
MSNDPMSLPTAGVSERLNNPTVIKFARTPALVQDTLLDYSTPEGMAIYKGATEKLLHPFDGDPAKLRMFLEALRQRSDAFGWTAILSVPDQDGIKRNLLHEYGRVTMTDVKNHALTYTHLDNRMSQNSVQLFTCLYASLTMDMHLKVSTDASTYRLSPRGILAPSEDDTIANGACFLKLLIMRSSVDTRATVFKLRTVLNSLNVYIASVNFDIERFNQHVRIQRDALLSRGELVSDLLTNLFAAYLAVDEPTFHSYMVSQRDQYYDGRIEFTVDSLMQIALDKFHWSMDTGEWSPKGGPYVSKEDQIVALSAKVEELKLQQGKPKGQGRKNKAKGEADQWAWKKIAPKSGEMHTKSRDGKTYHWCPNHIMWTIHTSGQCTLTTKRKDNTKGGVAEAPPKKAFTLDEAYQMIWEAQDDEGSNGDGPGQQEE